MQSLQRLTGSVLTRTWHQQAPLASRAFGISAGGQSGNESAGNSEARTAPKKQPKADSTHPFASRENPGRMRPDGSNSEEVVAALRSDTDPLEEVKKRRKPDGMPKRGEMQGKAKMSSQKKSTEQSPSLTQVEGDETADIVRGGPAAGP